MVTTICAQHQGWFWLPLVDAAVAWYQAVSQVLPLVVSQRQRRKALVKDEKMEGNCINLGFASKPGLIHSVVYV